MTMSKREATALIGVTPPEKQYLSAEERKLIDELAEGISKLCHRVISRRLQLYAEELKKQLKEQP